MATYLIYLALGKSIDEKQKFAWSIHSNNEVFAGFNHMKFCFFGDTFSKYFVLKNVARRLLFKYEE